MKSFQTIAFAAAIIMFLTQPTQAASVLQAGASSQSCRDFAVTASATVISAGDIVYCLNSNGPTPDSSSKLQMSAVIMTPALGSSPTVTFTPNVKSSSCSFGTAATAGTSLTAAFGTQSSASWEVTMTSNLCHGYIEGKVVSNGVTVFDDNFAFDVEANDYTTYVDNKNRECNHSEFQAACDELHTSLDITQWPALQTAANSKDAGGVQFEANGPLIPMPDSGSGTYRLLLTALVPANTAVGVTSISIAPLVDVVSGGNQICTVSSTVFTSNSGAMQDGSVQYEYKRVVTIDADYCHISGTATLNSAGAPVGQAQFSWIFMRHVDRLTGTLNSILSGSVSNAVSGTLTLSGIPDTQQELQAVADNLAAGLDVRICPVDSPCYLIVHGDLNSTTTLNGDINSNTTENNDFSEVAHQWWPMFVGLALLLVNAVRREEIKTLEE